MNTFSKMIINSILFQILTSKILYLFIFRGGKKLVIGMDSKPKLKVVVHNTKEPVFLPKLNVSVVPPLALLLPLSHDCSFPRGPDDRTSIECLLANPINKGQPVSKEFTRTFRQQY